MVIAVNLRSLSGDTASAAMLQGCFIKLAVSNPAVQIVFISNEAVHIDSELPNVKIVVLKQRSQNPVLWKWWYNYKLPSLLKKINASILVHAGAACSLKTKIPQFVFVTDISLLQASPWEQKKYGRFLRSGATQFLNKVEGVFTASQYIKSKLEAKFEYKKAIVLYPFPAENLQPLKWSVAETVKEKFTGGKEYFLYAGALNNGANLIHLLKAFSFFKKRQKSNMQLVLLATEGFPGNDLEASLRTYKFRDEVKLLTGLNPNEQQEIVAAAYAFVYPVLGEHEMSSLLNTICYGVPVITSASETVKEILGDAVLHTDPGSFEDIAQKMMLVFKDEAIRDEYIRRAAQKVTGYDINKAVALIKKTIAQ
ncbi:MAG: glycosyltransferase [Ferruginibacter sp.]